MRALKNQGLLFGGGRARVRTTRARRRKAACLSVIAND